MRSANEISAMVLKAARGAGMPLGCAEELARAAPALAHVTALEQVTALLELPFDAPKYEGGCVKGGHPVHALIAWRDFSAVRSDTVLECDVSDELNEAMCNFRGFTGPFDVRDATWSSLQTYAERMLVPESEASRLGGAGAGLTDND